MADRKSNSNDAQGQSHWPNAFLSPQTFAAGPQMMMEGARFWARRLHAYADWMETVAQCTTPTQLVEAQSRFFARTQEDYATETATVAQILGKDKPMNVAAK
jgi:hypothetical protein